MVIHKNTIAEGVQTTTIRVYHNAKLVKAMYQQGLISIWSTLDDDTDHKVDVTVRVVPPGHDPLYGYTYLDTIVNKHGQDLHVLYKQWLP